MRSSEPSITALTNGNFLISSSSWDSGSVVNAGAVTFGNGVTGVSGQVSELNSLIGSTRSERLGAPIDAIGTADPPAIVVLPNGDYVVSSDGSASDPASNAGSVTHGDGIAGTTGTISSANSLVGTSADDHIGDGGVTVLPSGDYVVISGRWNSTTVVRAGALTLVDGDDGLRGELNETNSLVGDRRSTFRNARVTLLVNENFVVSQPAWTNEASMVVGAVTLLDGSVRPAGLFDGTNSLVGTSDGDEIGLSFGVVGVTALSNGNYVVRSPNWNNGAVVDAGAVTWRSGTDFIGAIVSEANSFVGTQADQNVGGVSPLPNGNYVISSRGPDVSAEISTVATTFADGLTGVTGTADSERSLIFNHPRELTDARSRIVALPNGNVAVSYTAVSNSPRETGAVSALTLTTGEPGTSGLISEQNSLIGGRIDNSRPVVVLSNSNYVVRYSGSPDYYYGNGDVSPTGLFSEVDLIPGSSIYGLPSGNFVIEGGFGQTEYVELVDGTAGPAGQVPSSRSLAGQNSVALGNGNFAVRSGQDLVIGDGETPGVIATATPGVLGVGTTLIPLGVSGNLLAVSPGFTQGGTQNVGSIVFVDGSPDFNNGNAESNFWVGDATGFPAPRNERFEFTMDDVNEQFYVRFEIDGVSRIIAGSTVDGFADTGSDPDVDLSVSANTASEDEQTQITITATASSPVAGNQTVLVIPSGNGITDGDFFLSGQTITIPDGQTSGSVTLNIQRDLLVEGTESLLLTLANASSGIRLGATTQQTVAITDSTVLLVLDAVPRFPTDTTPTFTWNDVGADRYEVWLGQVSPISSRLQIPSRYVTGTSYTSNAELTTGVYRFWVRVNNTNGTPGPWSTPQVIGYRPQVSSPVSDVFTQRPTFTWEAIPDVEEYEIWIATRTGRIVRNGIFDTSYTPNQDLPAGAIRWWIRGLDNDMPGGSIAVDTPWSLVTELTVGGRTQVLSPTGTISDTTPTFSWQAIDGSSRYILFVQDRSSGNVVIRENSVTTTTFTPSTTLTSGNFRVWVKAIDSSGSFNSGTWSQPVDFTVAAATEESEELLSPQLAALPELLPASRHEKIGATVVVATEFTSDRATSPRVEPEIRQERAAPSVANSSESLLSLFWQQDQFQEWLLTGDVG